MADGEYKRSELSELSGVPERTIRYYIAKGLLPGPNRGSKSRYGDEHLGRLHVIRKLQEVPLPLDVIGDTLESMARGQAHQDRDDDGGAIEEPLEEAVAGSEQEEVHSFASEADAQKAANAALDYIRQAGSTVAKRLHRPEPSPSGPVARSTWERIALSDDIEVHVRRPLNRSQNRALDQLMEKAKQIFGEGES